MSIHDIPSLPTEKLIAIASFYEASVKKYYSKHMKDECKQAAKLCRDEVAKRG